MQFQCYAQGKNFSKIKKMCRQFTDETPVFHLFEENHKPLEVFSLKSFQPLSGEKGASLK